jgi:hypothetical protein
MVIESDVDGEVGILGTRTPHLVSLLSVGIAQENYGLPPFIEFMLFGISIVQVGLAAKPMKGFEVGFPFLDKLQGGNSLQRGGRIAI